MKTRISILLLFLLACTGFQMKKEDPIDGTWRLVAGTSKWSDTITADYAKMHYEGMKIFCANHFAFVGRYVTNSDTMDNYGGGSYTLEGNNYTESITFHVAKSLIGEIIPYEVHVQNDTLIQTGPRKIGKYQNTKWELYEVYVRMK